jgi:type I restriction enzyme, S subunit
MNAERLLALYENVAEAPDAIARLRRFVLDLAVRGKLVEQDPNDEPASELLKRIAVEKARLVEAGEIRKPRDLANGEELEPPFDVPVTWRWSRLDSVGAIIGGGTPPAGDPENFTEPGDGIPWLTPADLGGYRDLYIERGARDLTEKGLDSSCATMMPAGTVLFTSRAPIGYVAIAANPISTNQGFKSIVPYVADGSRFVALAMQTFAPEIDANAPGTTFKEVSGKIVAGVPFPRPPLAEQLRIVAKVGELMALLDRLEAARAAREATRDRLTTASLARLTAPDTTPEVFPAHARFALDALPALTTRRDQVKSLRQTILNLAVRGKLEEQNPNDEPASELLQQIALGLDDQKIGRGRKQKCLPSVDLAEAPYELPEGWTWAKVRQILDPCRDISYGVIKLGPEPKSGGIPTLRCSDVRPGFIDLTGIRAVEESIEADYARTRLDGGEIVINIRGTLGGVSLVPAALKGHNVAREVAVIPIASSLSGAFLVYLMLSSYFWDHIQNNLRGIAYKGLNLGILRDLPIPIPPLAEQHRIVAKVDELMALCDRLEAALATIDTTKQRLLEALLHEALEATLKEAA